MLVLAVAALASFQDPEPGIALALAQQRHGRIADVRYELAFRLEPGASEVTGTARLTFTLAEAGTDALVLDFAGAGLADVRLNGADGGADVRTVANHLVLAPTRLRAGANEFAASFRSAVAPTGTPLTVYRDPADGAEYWYTLVVPADAHRLYPCFDQPDLKATFAVTLDLPAAWTAVANGTGTGVERDGRRIWTFAPTRPLPTYLMAFAAGPFATATAAAPRADGVDPKQPFQILYRPSQRPHVDIPALVKLHDEGLRWLVQTFGVAYPFDKLDIVLLPGFPYGGMEHAGAIFYREQALAFDHPPTDGELVRRSTLVYHELSHQWFGNLVTMRWFDDLWLKEGFATFVGYQALAALEPERRAWLRFLQRVKPRAYEVDATAGTTPVWQQLQNLADAKSAYGAIVYNKAPAVLRELHERLGGKAFYAGLRTFLRAHAYGNATWQDLARALESATTTDLGRWSERWLLSPSMPEVRIAWQTDDHGIVRAATMTQKAIGGDGTWPLAVDLLVFERHGERRLIAARSDARQAPIEELIGRPAPVCVLPNPGDVAYAQFVPDATSRIWLSAHAAEEPDPLVRAVMVSALFEAVRAVEHDPALFGSLALQLLADERDPDTHAWLLDALGICLHRYLDDLHAEPLRSRTTALLLRQLAEESGSGRELTTFRFLARSSSDPEVLELCRAVASDGPLPKGLEPGKQDRFLAAAALLAAGAAADELTALRARFAKEDVGKEEFLARAAIPTVANKQHYFEQYLQLGTPPEQWTQDSLAWFHWPGQTALTLPFLRPALERVDWVKQNRRIFFMPAWLDGFINAHSSPEALQVVTGFARTAELSDDIRRKLLQSVDGLERAVAIRAAWPR